MAVAAFPAAAADCAAGTTVHQVRWNDTLEQISRTYGVDIVTLRDLNGISNINLIFWGTTLCIGTPEVAPPAVPPAIEYQVRYGDTLSQIAYAFGQSVSAIASANGIANVNYILTGETLIVP